MRASRGSLRRAIARGIDELRSARIFAPVDLSPAPNAVRTSSGVPGPSYWQNRADYAIHATLDTAAKSIAGTVAITYTNNSPDALDTLWLQLDQNLYRPDSRGAFSRGSFSRRGAPSGSTGGMTLDAATVTVAGRSVAIVALIDDTRAALRLPAALASGGKAVVTIRYHYTVPGLFGGRTAWGKSRDGEIYDLAQWYPRMAVYDDLRGWDPLPYLAQEFYLEYGTFNYWVTVPSDMIVAGSGALMNPREVLTASQRTRLAKARTSDATVTIRAPDEIARPRGALVTVETHDKLVMPATLHVAFADGSSRDVRLPAETWIRQDATAINVGGTSKVVRATIDPDHKLPDRDRSNNEAR